MRPVDSARPVESNRRLVHSSVSRAILPRELLKDDPMSQQMSCSRTSSRSHGLGAHVGPADRSAVITRSSGPSEGGGLVRREGSRQLDQAPISTREFATPATAAAFRGAATALAINPSPPPLASFVVGEHSP